MSHRTVITIAAAALLGVASVSTDVSARGFHGGGYHRGFHRGVYGGGYGRGGWHGGYYGRGGWGWGAAAGAAAVGAAAIGAAATAPYYYSRPACGYYPYPAC